MTEYERNEDHDDACTQATYRIVVYDMARRQWDPPTGAYTTIENRFTLETAREEVARLRREWDTDNVDYETIPAEGTYDN